MIHGPWAVRGPASLSPLWLDLFLHAAAKAKGKNTLHHPTWHSSNGYKWVFKEGEAELGGACRGVIKELVEGAHQGLLYHCIKELFLIQIIGISLLIYQQMFISGKAFKIQKGPQSICSLGRNVRFFPEAFWAMGPSCGFPVLPTFSPLCAKVSSHHLSFLKIGLFDLCKNQQATLSTGSTIHRLEDAIAGHHPWRYCY